MPFRTLEQAYENAGFITIRRAANNRTYSTRQHSAVFVLLHAVSHHSRFCVAVCDAYRQQLPYEFHAHTTGCALSITYLKACESSNKMSRAVSSFRHSGFKRYVAVYTGRTLMRVRWLYWLCVGQASGTRESSSGSSNLSSMRRVLQSVMAAATHRRSGTEDKG